MDINYRIENILKVLDQIPDRSITVFGDFCLDKYLYINSARNERSLETGHIAYQVDRKSLFPGAGGTVAGNLRALGASVFCVGLVGDDGEGYELLEGLDKIGAETGLMVRSKDIMTGTYIKPMLGSDDQPYSEIDRIDIRNFKKTSHELEDRLLKNLEKALAVSEGIVVTDQFLELDYSVVTGRIRNELAMLPRRYPDKVFYADSRGFVRDYRNIIVKCNQFELPGADSGSMENDSGSEKHDKEAILKDGAELLTVNGCAVVVTSGANGAYIFEGDTVDFIPAFKVEGPIDIVGAGDATSAGVILGKTLGLSLPDSVLLGCCISSITIRQLGVTGTATIGQIKQQLAKR